MAVCSIIALKPKRNCSSSSCASSPTHNRTLTTCLMELASIKSSTLSTTPETTDNSCIRGQFCDGQQRRRDFIQSRAGFATGGNHLDVRLQGMHVARKVCDLDVHHRCQVGLVDHDDVCAEKHVWML